jgi:hypothetical protein
MLHGTGTLVSLAGFFAYHVKNNNMSFLLPQSFAPQQQSQIPLASQLQVFGQQQQRQQYPVTSQYTVQNQVFANVLQEVEDKISETYDDIEDVLSRNIYSQFDYDRAINRLYHSGIGNYLYERSFPWRQFFEPHYEQTLSRRDRVIRDIVQERLKDLDDRLSVLSNMIPNPSYTAQEPLQFGSTAQNPIYIPSPTPTPVPQIPPYIPSTFSTGPATQPPFLQPSFQPILPIGFRSAQQPNMTLSFQPSMPPTME